MGIIFMDALTQYEPNKWHASSMQLRTDVGVGVNGLNYLQATYPSLTQARTRVLTPSGSKLVINFWYRRTTAHGTVGFCQIQNSSQAAQVILGATSGGLLRLLAGDNSTVLATGTKVLLVDTWYHIEWDCTVSNSISAGQCSVKLDGNAEIDAPAGSDTQYQSTNNISHVLWVGNNDQYDKTQISHPIIFDDGTFRGDIRLQVLNPNGNGTTSDWTGSDADSTDNYLHVDETGADDADTSYVESSTVGQVDLYALENLSLTPDSILGIRHMTMCRKTDTDVRTIKPILRVNGTNYERTEHTLITSYEAPEEVVELSPDTGVAWTQTEIDAMEIGVKVES